MNHPPIPPKCEWFFVQTAAPGKFGFNTGDDDWWPLDTEEKAEAKYWRRTVAAVARCAFLDLGDNENAERWKIWGQN